MANHAPLTAGLCAVLLDPQGGSLLQRLSCDRICVTEVARWLVFLELNVQFVNSVLLDCRLLVTSRIILRAHQLGKSIVSTILAVSLTRFTKWLANSKISLSALPNK